MRSALAASSARRSAAAGCPLPRLISSPAATPPSVPPFFYPEITTTHSLAHLPPAPVSPTPASSLLFAPRYFSSLLHFPFLLPELATIGCSPQKHSPSGARQSRVRQWGVSAAGTLRPGSAGGGSSRCRLARASFKLSDTTHHHALRIDGSACGNAQPNGYGAAAALRLQARPGRSIPHLVLGAVVAAPGKRLGGSGAGSGGVAAGLGVSFRTPCHRHCCCAGLHWSPMGAQALGRRNQAARQHF